MEAHRKAECTAVDVTQLVQARWSIFNSLSGKPSCTVNTSDGSQEGRCTLRLACPLLGGEANEGCDMGSAFTCCVFGRCLDDPPVSRNALISPSAGFSTHLLYTCPDGLRFKDGLQNHTVLCGWDGEWSPKSIPNCVHDTIECPVSPPVLHPVIVDPQWTGRREVGAEVNVTCPEGMHFSGDEADTFVTIRCSSAGEWLPAHLPQCVEYDLNGSRPFCSVDHCPSDCTRVLRRGDCLHCRCSSTQPFLEDGQIAVGADTGCPRQYFPVRKDFSIIICAPIPVFPINTACTTLPYGNVSETNPAPIITSAPINISINDSVALTCPPKFVFSTGIHHIQIVCMGNETWSVDSLPLCVSDPCESRDCGEGTCNITCIAANCTSDCWCNTNATLSNNTCIAAVVEESCSVSDFPSAENYLIVPGGNMSEGNGNQTTTYRCPNGTVFNGLVEQTVPVRCSESNQWEPADLPTCVQDLCNGGAKCGPSGVKSHYTFCTTSNRCRCICECESEYDLVNGVCVQCQPDDKGVLPDQCPFSPELPERYVCASMQTGLKFWLTAEISRKYNNIKITGKIVTEYEPKYDSRVFVVENNEKCFDQAARVNISGFPIIPDSQQFQYLVNIDGALNTSISTNISSLDGAALVLTEGVSQVAAGCCTLRNTSTFDGVNCDSDEECFQLGEHGVCNNGTCQCDEISNKMETSDGTSVCLPDVQHEYTMMHYFLPETYNPPNATLEEKWPMECNMNYLLVGVADRNFTTDLDFIKCVRLQNISLSSTEGSIFDPDLSTNNASAASCEADQLVVGLWDDSAFYNSVNKVKCRALSIGHVTNTCQMFDLSVAMPLVNGSGFVPSPRLSLPAQCSRQGLWGVTSLQREGAYWKSMECCRIILPGLAW